jgi:hypothetical protein
MMMEHKAFSLLKDKPAMIAIARNTTPRKARKEGKVEVITNRLLTIDQLLASKKYE